ncbi:MAG: GAF domain-containing sensor histidine kinase, partial [Candidatus Falkowbacteria bacterium]
AIKYFLNLYFFEITVWADFIILILAILAFQPVKNYFYRIANKYFFSSLYDSSEVIATLSEKLRSTLEAEKIYQYIYDTLTNAFHVKAFGLLTHNEEKKIYIIQYNQGFKTGSQTSFMADKTLHEMFVSRNKTIVTEEVKRFSELEKNQTISLLLKLGVEILAPLNVKDKTIGLIALGAKESGDMYNEEDLKVLEVVGAQAAIALENALLYKETKNFSVKMEKEVEKATRDLKKANVQLKKLDAAKSEFISIASHQLRTPLTVIKGYISMMLEGNFGQLTKLETESLEKVFVSNERLIQLVENLLNISRIESGRLQFDFHEVDLNKMVEGVIEELAGNAKKKNLILQYKPPAKPLPKIKIDDEKIRQVVMNLIDNGIKYTKQGSVTVKLEQAGNKIRFLVADSGVGIRPEDMANLFKKFSRGSRTSLIHTEGTGLGLYVARMMVEAHHGKIWAESSGEGKGSKFCFELPVK